MDNLILKSLSAENFAAFADEVCFTTEIDYGKKEYWENAFDSGDMRFNKVSFLYGANGSGKTFFCKIMREIQRLLAWSPLTAMNNHSQLLALPQFQGINAPVKPFLFDVAYEEKPSKFALEIILNGVTFHYEFVIQGNIVLSELLTKKRLRTEKLLERTSPDFHNIVLRSELKGFEDKKDIVKPEALCLPLAALCNNPLAMAVVEAIQRIQVINMAAGRLSPTASKDSFAEERIEKYVNVLKKADPTLRQMDISFSEEEIARQKVENKTEPNDFENREQITKTITVGVQTQHAVYRAGQEEGCKPINFFVDESLGTVKLFTALPYLYDILESGGVLMVDELENGLHLSLAKEIIALFSNEESNPNHAQLICTSHQPLLVSGAFRRDQVWIAQKDSYGKSRLHRVSELKTSRSKINLSNRILEGALGCNPDLFFG